MNIRTLLAEAEFGKKNLSRFPRVYYITLPRNVPDTTSPDLNLSIPPSMYLVPFFNCCQLIPYRCEEECPLGCNLPHVIVSRLSDSVEAGEK